MFFKSLTITDFRNIRHAEIELHPQLNIFFGNNGSGKTSVLEALSLLSSGRSFRSNLVAPLINHDVNVATVFAQLDDTRGSISRLGISKHRSRGTSIKYNSGNVSSSSQLARMLPLQSVDGSSFNFLEGGTKHRRSLLDWLVFHVEHSFLDASKAFYSALKQRNALLRHGIIKDGQLAVWSDKLVTSGEQVNKARQEVFKLVANQFGLVAEELNPLNLEFNSGWASGVSLSGAFEKSFTGDIDRKSTRVGPHRADIEFTTNNKKAVEILSRGQKKKLILLFYLAVIRVFEQQKHTVVNVALDDLTAELDKQAVALILSHYLEVNSQLFVTVIDPELILSVIPKDKNYSLFHVEQGVITKVENP